MKIIITGSLGHISKPLTEELLQKGHTVTVISSKPKKQAEIEALGAIAAIGTVEDIDFLAATFTGADVVYTMLPPPDFHNANFDLMAHCDQLADNFSQAIEKSRVTHVVHLSSIGAHTGEGVGMLAFHHNVESILGKLPQHVAIKFMRPVGFYYNLFAFVNTIKTQSAIVSNYGGDDKEPWVSPIDIAAAISEEIVKPFSGRSIRYVASDELSPNEVAAILGEAIGKPDLQWIAIPDEQLLNGMMASGMNAGIAKGYVEMNASRRGGVLYEDYFRHHPVLGKVKLKDFARDFAAIYNQS